MTVIVVMPAYNAAETLQETFQSIPADYVDHVILVDDGSVDETAVVARSLEIETIVHPHNAGYGANQKTCYMEALRLDAEVVIMLHPDGQYDPRIIPDMIEAIRTGQGDFVMGSRFLPPESALAGGMPRYKYIANRFLTTVENRIMGTSLSECHTGYRGYSRRLLETIPFLRNSNDFVFDTQMIFQANHFGFRFAEVPVSTRYFDEASSISFRASMKYGLQTLGVGWRYLLHRSGIWPSPLFKPARQPQHARKFSGENGR